MQIQNPRELLDRYLSGECSTKETIQVEAWLEAQSDHNNAWEKMTSYEKAEWLQALYKGIKDTVGISNPEEKNNNKVIHFNTRWLIRIAAAAVVIFMIGTGAYLMLSKKIQKDIPGTIAKKWGTNKDILPGGNKAILTLADGSTIILDSAKNGLLAKQGSTTVIKLNGKLNYNSSASATTEITYNTIATPRGGTYQIELPDGSLVWLNAASSLRFPTAFSAGERKVEVTGEAYFEVVKNKAMPFIVHVNNSTIRVMGTHFNVMAYDNESSLTTTLLEGAVKFVNGNDSSILEPGQQTQFFGNGRLDLLKAVDLENVIAWKEGSFHFEGENLEIILRQLTRWYDIEVVYENKKTENLFYLEMPRNTKLADILKVLELSSGIHFKIEGKIVKVIS
ncbi:MAG: FecR domain-containing protein [Ferruginibacter sp.]